MDNKYLICIVGPTAIGKTALSLHLAKEFRTEIISSDSRQFFQEMSIGTAVPTAAELSTVPHHFIQHLSISDPYSVGKFEQDALRKLEELHRKKDVVIMVGGSGLYVDAVLHGMDEFPSIPADIRQDLNKVLSDSGLVPLQQQLQKLDPEYYDEVDRENPHRIIRALEVCYGTGKPYSSFRRKKKAKRSFNSVIIGLTAQREILYERINQRVDFMMQHGLLQEAKALYPQREQNALNTVGYKELFRHFDGHCSLEEAISEIKKNTRRFSKRQLTWFRKNKQIHWFDYRTSPEQIIASIKKEIEKRY